MVKKVLRTGFIAICKGCNHVFDLNKKSMREREEQQGSIPFSAKSSNSTVFCPKCNEREFNINFEYKNVYRMRCVKCGQMFDAEKTYQHKCPPCQEKYMKAVVGFGA